MRADVGGVDGDVAVGIAADAERLVEAKDSGRSALMLKRHVNDRPANCRGSRLAVIHARGPCRQGWLMVKFVQESNKSVRNPQGEICPSHPAG